MTGTPSEAGLWIWRVPECPRQIEYSPSVLDEIRLLAVDAFFSLPRGGAEIGGILFGTHQGEVVRILAFRAMECEHGLGPTFVLSDNDKAHLGTQLEEVRHDPALRGMAVVGWYHSHTRSEIFLSELDLDIHREFFPEPWQVALVLRPAGMKPTRAGFFLSDAKGAIRSAASYREFVVGASPGTNVVPVGSKPANGRSVIQQASDPLAPPRIPPDSSEAEAEIPSHPAMQPAADLVAPPIPAYSSEAEAEIPSHPAMQPAADLVAPPIPAYSSEAEAEIPPHPAMQPAADLVAPPIPAYSSEPEAEIPPGTAMQPASGPVAPRIPSASPEPPAELPPIPPRPVAKTARPPVEAVAEPAQPPPPRTTALFDTDFIPTPPAEEFDEPREHADEPSEVSEPSTLSDTVEIQPEEFVPPAFLAPPERRRSRAWLWIVLFVVAAAGAGAYFSASYWMRFLSHKPTNLRLQALDQDGQLRIQWDRNSLASQNIQGGTLEIVDGPSTTRIPLDPPRIHAGSFQYARRTEMVEVHMTIQTGSSSPVEEFTSFIGQPPRQADPQETANLAAEAEKSRAELLKEQTKRLELEESLKKMQDAVRRDEERRRVANQLPAGGAPSAASKSKPAPVDPPAQTTSNRTSGPAPAVPSSPAPPDKTAAASEKAAEQASNAALAGPPQGSLSGRWVFSRASKTGSPFPPESVTLAMTEANGQVRGVLVGRYRVPRSRRFSSNVKFNFEGPVHPASSKFSIAEGMKGHIEVIRLPGKQDAIEVVWYSERDKLTFDDIFFRVP